MTEAISSLIEYIEIATLPSVARHDDGPQAGTCFGSPLGAKRVHGMQKISP
jgi:hypothetical protein